MKEIQYDTQTNEKAAHVFVLQEFCVENITLK